MCKRVWSWASAVALAGAVALPRPAEGQQPLVLVPIRADSVMSRAELERTGIARLTPAERFAFDGWLTRYVAELRQAASAPRTPATAAAEEEGDVDLEDGLLTAGRAADVEPADDSASVSQGRRRRFARLAPVGAPLTAPLGARLVATPEEGNYVRLADGTVWEVYLPDRTATVTWRRGEYVTVSRAASSVGNVGEFDHVLINAPSRSRAHVRFVGLVPPRGR